MALEFKLPEGHQAGVEVARLTITCPRHPDDPIVHCCRSADGGGYYETTSGFRSEYIADAEPWPAGSLPPGAARLGLDEAAAVVPDDAPHFRVHLDCIRPSCEYRAVLRCDGPGGFWALFDLVLDRMVASGVAHATVSNAEDWRQWGDALTRAGGE